MRHTEAAVARGDLIEPPPMVIGPGLNAFHIVANQVLHRLNVGANLVLMVIRKSPDQLALSDVEALSLRGAAGGSGGSDSL